MEWRTSSFSGGSNNCVELAREAEVAGVRDSKCRDGGVLWFPPRSVDALLAEVKR
ncbi:DUF397 domain-containing protein [Actinokineospora sp. UTMC 2448]|uniref:DUF397 domain-containing protein n=1 Tax=Actinokineospora sp. UTMC 2448 TaxID=2268449 RepID=UPI002164D2D1|nr:DUF397 domain-containing protein [Actinokineospora sp. UTMC 2448]UVS82566.1 hypothetical protein Actkin_06339 [Actinokineospora sp. UTMC 2448]